jgi:hypothetical protein
MGFSQRETKIYFFSLQGQSEQNQYVPGSQCQNHLEAAFDGYEPVL